MSETCVFCKIVRGEMPSHSIYEDAHVMAFLSIDPIREGHVLVIPKNHVEEFIDMSDTLTSHVMHAVKRIGLHIKEIYKPRRVVEMTQGFDVPHLHVHVVPADSTIEIATGLLNAGKTEPNHEVLASVAQRLRLT